MVIKKDFTNFNSMENYLIGNFDNLSIASINQFIEDTKKIIKEYGLEECFDKYYFTYDENRKEILGYNLLDNNSRVLGYSKFWQNSFEENEYLSKLIKQAVLYCTINGYDTDAIELVYDKLKKEFQTYYENQYDILGMQISILEMTNTVDYFNSELLYDKKYSIIEIFVISRLINSKVYDFSFINDRNFLDSIKYFVSNISPNYNEMEELERIINNYKFTGMLNLELQKYKVNILEDTKNTEKLANIADVFNDILYFRNDKEIISFVKELSENEGFINLMNICSKRSIFTRERVILKNLMKLYFHDDESKVFKIFCMLLKQNLYSFDKTYSQLKEKLKTKNNMISWS